MSKINYELDPDRPRPPVGGNDLGRRLLTLIVVLAVAGGGLYALIKWSAPTEQPENPQPPAPITETVVPDEPTAPEEVVAEPLAVETPPPIPEPTPMPEPVETTPVTPPEPEPLPEEEPEYVDYGKDGGVPVADSALQKKYVAASGALAERSYQNARALAIEALKMPECTPENPLWRPIADVLGSANAAIALNSIRTPEKIAHKVVSGDALDKLANKYGTTREAIQLSNNMKLDNTNIKLGFTLHILPAKWEIVIDQEKHLLYLNNNGSLFKVYDIGVGKDSRTPPGAFKIASRIKNPTWFTPTGKEIPFGDPGNVLGTRWMTLEATGDTPHVNGIGIHGTWDEKTVGSATSNGCIRLRNHDVEELFNLVPHGTPVKIKN